MDGRKVSRRVEGREREARRVDFDKIQLQRWWYSPNDRTPSEIHAVVQVLKAGRLAARVQGRTIPAGNGFDEQVFAGETKDDPTLNLGDEAETVLPLIYYADGAAGKISLHLMLITETEEGVPDTISKIYETGAERNDTGKFFYAPLPAPMPPNSP